MDLKIIGPSPKVRIFLGLLFFLAGLYITALLARSVNAQIIELLIGFIIVGLVIFPTGGLLIIPDKIFRNRAIRHLARFVGLLSLLAGIFLFIVYFPFFIMGLGAERQFLQFSAFIMVLNIFLIVTSRILFNRARQANELE